jgi:hypothetical protein
MLLVSRAHRAALHVPVILLVVSTAWVVGSSYFLAVNPGIGLALSTIMGGIAALVTLAMIKVARRRQDRLEIRGIFRNKSLPARACAFGIEKNHRVQGGDTYEVYVTDGQARAEVAEMWFARQASRSVQRLSAALLDAEPEGLFEGVYRKQAVAADPAAAAKEKIAARRDAQAAAEAHAQRQVHGYYQSRGWQRLKWIIPVVIGVYLLIMLVFYLTVNAG